VASTSYSRLSVSSVKVNQDNPIAWVRYQMIPSTGIKPQPTGRPAHKERSKKLRDAKTLITAGKWSPAHAPSLKEQLDALEEKFNIDTTLREDQEKIFLQCLSEINADHYAGQFPPTPATEPACKNLELFPFSWKSNFFQGYEMYFKFVISKGTDQEVFIISIHESDY
jgi:hypothetical protein